MLLIVNIQLNAVKTRLVWRNAWKYSRLCFSLEITACFASSIRMLICEFITFWLIIFEMNSLFDKRTSNVSVIITSDKRHCDASNCNCDEYTRTNLWKLVILFQRDNKYLDIHTWWHKMLTLTNLFSSINACEQGQTNVSG